MGTYKQLGRAISVSVSIQPSNMSVLYKCNASAPSRAVLMTIEILKITDKLQYADVNPMLGENRKPEFLKKNPLHTVPVLDDEGFIICDSHVIMTYLTSKFAPQSSLYPSDLKIKSIVDQRMYFESTCMTPKIISGVDSLKKGLKELTEEQIAALKEVYSVLDKYLEQTPFLVTDHVTLADVSCISSLASLNLFLPIPQEFINLRLWYNRLEKEDWFQKINAPGVKSFGEKLDELKSQSG
ncbi:glutathione S-transferase 1-like [Pectinophora gossypiella]|uniref:glutathione S-transferase 1-like n=1 Tax=Pectinophora gossypiella TaxID=13191 RepID=UPI00214EFA0A|nr:glutathione S-transferase 1-like [Pectinophora gossypiella]